jgi:hypothetical protein
MTPPGVRTNNPSKRAATNPRLRPRGHWGWQNIGSELCKRWRKFIIVIFKYELVITKRSSTIKPSEKEREYRKWKNTISSFNHLWTAENSTEVTLKWLKLHRVFHTCSSENPTSTRISHRMSWRRKVRCYIFVPQNIRCYYPAKQTQTTFYTRR